MTRSGERYAPGGEPAASLTPTLSDLAASEVLLQYFQRLMTLSVRAPASSPAVLSSPQQPTFFDDPHFPIAHFNREDVAHVRTVLSSREFRQLRHGRDVPGLERLLY